MCSHYSILCYKTVKIIFEKIIYFYVYVTDRITNCDNSVTAELWMFIFTKNNQKNVQLYQTADPSCVFICLDLDLLTSGLCMPSACHDIPVDSSSHFVVRVWIGRHTHTHTHTQPFYCSSGICPGPPG